MKAACVQLAMHLPWRYRNAATQKQLESKQPEIFTICGRGASVLTRKQLQKRALQPCAQRAEFAKWTGAMLSSGAVSGPLLDAIHSKTQLQVYTALPVDIGGFHTSAVVPIVLSLYYAIAGGLLLWLDSVVDDDATAQIRSKQSFAFIALNAGVLAGLLQLSCVLYTNGVSYTTIWAVLSACALINWKILDGTRQGLALAAFCGLVAPLSEIVILKLFGWWYYTQPDFLGITSWVVTCYFFYTPFVSNMARYFWSKTKLTSQQ